MNKTAWPSVAYLLETWTLEHLIRTRSNDSRHLFDLFHVSCWFCTLIHGPFTNTEEAGLMTYSAASHQVLISEALASFGELSRRPSSFHTLIDVLPQAVESLCVLTVFILWSSGNLSHLRPSTRWFRSTTRSSAACPARSQMLRPSPRLPNSTCPSTGTPHTYSTNTRAHITHIMSEWYMYMSAYTQSRQDRGSVFCSTFDWQNSNSDAFCWCFRSRRYFGWSSSTVCLL